MTMKKTSKIAWVNIALIGVILAGCSIIPKNIHDTQLAPDSSTPSNYSIYNNGILYTVLNQKNEVLAVVITSHKRDEFNQLIEKYHERFLKMRNVKLEKDAGIKPIKDQYGNDVFSIDAEHFKFLVIMKTWGRGNIQP